MATIEQVEALTDALERMDELVSRYVAHPKTRKKAASIMIRMMTHIRKENDDVVSRYYDLDGDLMEHITQETKVAMEIIQDSLDRYAKSG